MKDITEEWVKSLSDDEIEKHRSYMLFGEHEKLPEHIVRTMISLSKYIEIKNLTELKENYSTFREKSRMPFKSFMFLLGLFSKVTKKMKYMKDYLRMDEKYGEIQRELYGGRSSMRDIIQRKMEFPSQLILYDVKLENFEHVKNDLFSAYKFQVIDRAGERINAVFVYEEMVQQFFSPKDSVIIDRKSSIDMARGADSSKTWVVYAMTLGQEYSDYQRNTNKREKRLYVRMIQDGGVKSKPDIPFLTIK